MIPIGNAEQAVGAQDEVRSARAMTGSVLVVGAGPAGLVAAMTLARCGVEVVLVEQHDALSELLPRAASVSTRTMELLRSWGLEAQVREGGIEVEWRRWVGRTLLGPGASGPISLPTREQSLVGLDNRPAGVRVVLREVGTGRHRTMRARFVVDLESRIERIGAFSFAAQLAERFRSESAFLVGDAAHQVTPRGGTGMDTAIQGANNLAWKPAWVLRGWAAASPPDAA